MEGLEKISKYAGMREDLVQAGGGNSAVKTAPDKMAVKASGCQLADVSSDSGFALVDHSLIRDAFMNCADMAELTEERSKKILSDAFIEGARPSIETFLHAVSGKYSLHTHPITVNALCCRKNGREELGKLFPEALIVPYATPGAELAKAYFTAYREYIKAGRGEPGAVFLMNHGLLVSGDTPEEVIEKTESITGRIEEYLGLDMSGYRAVTELWEMFTEGIIWRVTDINVLEMYRRSGVWDHCFCPDCVVFLGKKMFRITSAQPDKGELKKFTEEYGTPVIIARGNDLYIHSASVRKAMEIQSVLSFSAQVMSVNGNTPCEYLTDRERDHLLNWEAEKYRQRSN